MIDVFAPLARYRTAAAELPLRTRTADAAPGAVVIVPGDDGDWASAATRAAADGAAALVIADPVLVPADVVSALSSRLTIPVVVERPRLRADAVADARAARAGSAEHVLSAEGSGPAATLPSMARDACGWLRVLSGGELEAIAGDRSLALLRTTGGLAATLGTVATTRRSAGMRVEVLGEVRTQVDVGAGVRIVTTGAAGALIAPMRFESSARLALRHALDAIATGEEPDDLAALAADTALLERLSAPRR